MKSYIERLLLTFGYDSYGALGESLAPSFKYEALQPLTLIASATMLLPLKILGLTEFAFLALLIVMVTELVSGVWASHVKKETFSSMKLSRFTFKTFQYLVIIGVTHLFSESFKSQGKDLGATIFDWMHLFLTVQIVQEHIISILESGAAIGGKPKSHWLTKLTDKINGFFS